jgi:hypothetical protein
MEGKHMELITWGATEILNIGIIKYFFLPIFIAWFGVYIKISNRNDKWRTFNLEDLAIGPDLMLTSFFSFIVLVLDNQINKVKLSTISNCLGSECTDTAVSHCIGNHTSYFSDRSQGYVVFIIITLIILIVINPLIRQCGWINKNKMHWFFGIFFPLAIGIILLSAVFRGAQ